jgi:hypothetical protein
MEQEIKMKKTVAAIAITLALAGSAFAKDKLPERVYDRTGQMVSVSGMIHSDVDIHVSAGGTSVDAYCAVGEASVNCYDSPAYAGTIPKLEDGRTIVPGAPKIVFIDEKIAEQHIDSVAAKYNNNCTNEKFVQYPNNYDPFHALYHDAISKPNGTKTPFQYRLATGDAQGQMICMPFVLTDKKGSVKHHGEACYQ